MSRSRCKRKLMRAFRAGLAIGSLALLLGGCGWFSTGPLVDIPPASSTSSYDEHPRSVLDGPETITTGSVEIDPAVDLIALARAAEAAPVPALAGPRPPVHVVIQGVPFTLPAGVRATPTVTVTKRTHKAMPEIHATGAATGIGVRTNDRTFSIDRLKPVTSVAGPRGAKGNSQGASDVSGSNPASAAAGGVGFLCIFGAVLMAGGLVMLVWLKWTGLGWALLAAGGLAFGCGLFVLLIADTPWWVMWAGLAVILAGLLLWLWKSGRLAALYAKVKTTLDVVVPGVENTSPAATANPAQAVKDSIKAEAKAAGAADVVKATVSAVKAAQGLT